MSLREYSENSRKLGNEYGIHEKTVRYIVTEYKDKNDEAVAAARLFYVNSPRNLQPTAHRGNSAQLAVISRAVTHSTHPAQAVGMQPFAAVAGQSSFFRSGADAAADRRRGICLRW